MIRLSHGYFQGGIQSLPKVSPTIDAHIACWHVLIGEKMEEIKCKHVGQITAQGYTEMTGRVYGQEGISPTINTCCDGHREPKILEEPTERFFKQALDTAKSNECEVGDTIDAFNERINKSGISPTITTRPEGFKTAILPIDQKYRVRKLTERECGKLMGVKPEDCKKIARNLSKSAQYHCYGDSIVVTVLMALFGEMTNIDFYTKIKQTVEEILNE